MAYEMPVYLGPDAVSGLVEFCNQHNLKDLTLVADQRTYSALGRRVAQALSAAGSNLITVVLEGDEVVADANYVMQVLVNSDARDRTLVAVGAGTITDISRFVSHRTRTRFVSLPTAPSVDGFTSIGAPMIVAGLKRTFITHPPIAIFADLTTLQQAPQRLIAAGFGDMLGKLTSLADWDVGRLIWGEPYDADIARRSRTAAQRCMQYASQIGRAEPQAVQILMEGLIESGRCMLDFGTSRPASGSEHHCSHYWEMKLLWEDRPALLHGAKVGVATVLIAGFYDRLRYLSVEEVSRKLQSARLPDRDEEVRRIESAYGFTADEVISAQSDFLNLTSQDYEDLKVRIVDTWPQILDIANQVPPAEELAALLRAAGAPATPAELGLSQVEVEQALAYGHYLRNRFTVLKLGHLFDLV